MDGDGDIDAFSAGRGTIAWYENACMPPDCDGDVDVGDFLRFTACMTSPGGGPAAGCHLADRDNDVDLADLVSFQAAFTGAR